MLNILRNTGTYQSYRPEAPRLYGLPQLGFRLDERPQVWLIQAAGNVTSGTHTWKITFKDAGGETTPGDKSRTLTTATASAGQVAIYIPEFPTGATHANVYRQVAGSTGAWKLVNASPLAAATYERSIYVDNVADGSLGADAPSSNTTTTPIVDPPTLTARIEALTAGSDTDYLIAYFLMDYRWVEMDGADNNVLMFVPGAFASDGSAAYDWPYDPQNRPWSATDSPSDPVSLPTFSVEGTALYDVLEAAKSRYMPVTIAWGEDVGGILKYVVTCTPDGGTTISREGTVRADVALDVCRVLLQTIHDVDFV